MNLEQRERIDNRINQLFGLLAYAKAHDDTEEATRIEAELKELIESL
ncbi:MAG: hypothetical protein K6F50_06190 [Kiritimatiellae bacterium]|nr:hypothetical protein [Kiritimatiellia bacterium]